MREVGLNTFTKHQETEVSAYGKKSRLGKIRRDDRKAKESLTNVFNNGKRKGRLSTKITSPSYEGEGSLAARPKFRNCQRQRVLSSVKRQYWETILGFREKTLFTERVPHSKTMKGRFGKLVEDLGTKSIN